MISPLRTPLVTVFQAEVLLNSKRIAPYAMMVLFSANALLWWGRGPAVVRGWATNSDYFIIWLFGGFSFMTLPFFIAVLMGDPVIRDFRFGIDPLIFSKPISRLEYLLGKFLGNFFVLVCCQASFALTALCLSLAHLFFERKSNVGLRKGGRLSGERWTILITLAAAAMALITGLMIKASW